MIYIFLTKLSCFSFIWLVCVCVCVCARACTCTQSCLTLCSPMGCSMPGSSVFYYLPEFAQTHVHWVGNWCHPTISSSAALFFICPQSFPTSGSFPMSLLFTSRGQYTGASASILPVNIQRWPPLGWTGLISLQSRGLSRGFSNTVFESIFQ